MAESTARAANRGGKLAHALFVHQNYPAQFGHVASKLVSEHGWKCTFLTARPPSPDSGNLSGIERIQYFVRGAAAPSSNYFSRTFENQAWHAQGIYEAMAQRRDIKPDIVIGHSGWGPTLLLRDLYRCPFVGFFEFYYWPSKSDLDFRPDFPPDKASQLRARTRNAMLLLELEHCDRGYSPTAWQKNRFPPDFLEKIDVVFDGIDTDVWKPMPRGERVIVGERIPDDVRIVTYVSRGLESMRGFDIFMQSARRICDRRKDVVFAVVGEDRCVYGNDAEITKSASFKEWVLSRDRYDLSRFRFLGRLPTNELAALLAITDLHIYLTVPFVLSWSLFNAMACGAAVLGSNTEPVREVIRDGANGLLVDFFDVEEIARAACRALDDHALRERLGAAAIETIRDNYSIQVCMPKLLRTFDAARDFHRRRPPRPL